ncbi:MAG: PAS domain-containing sensor histidine kinase [Chitinophagaceae bacterium]|nr:MAG: PAS domain-containing sensor histidine kinase [Chitinophagaceae bacterium]
MDNRFRKINKLLSEYSKGNFDRAIPLSDKLDDLDAIISGINMLGEELKAIAISRDYFNNILHSVSDMVFILNKRWRIHDINESVCRQLGYDKKDLIGRSVMSIQALHEKNISSRWLKEVTEKDEVSHTSSYFNDVNLKQIPVQVNASPITGGNNKGTFVILTARDSTLQISTENAVLRAMIDAQEKERHRIAGDIHDSLGQQLSAIKFFIGAMADRCTDVKQKDNLLVSNKALVNVIGEMRNICFDLVPSTLGEFGLMQAVKELCSQPAYKGKVRFLLREDASFPSLPADMEIDLFRVLQEFITNALNHGQATNITIRCGYTSGIVRVILKDNGRGFNTDVNGFKGRGLQNVRSRIKSHNGELMISSMEGKGTVFKITIPVSDKIKKTAPSNIKF